jgi:hypothetical protein
VVLATTHLRGTVGHRTRIAFGVTQPGRATLTVKRGGRRVSVRHAAVGRPGAGTVTLRALARGTYRVSLAFVAADGQQHTVTARLVVGRR